VLSSYEEVYISVSILVIIKKPLEDSVLEHCIVRGSQLPARACIGIHELSHCELYCTDPVRGPVHSSPCDITRWCSPVFSTDMPSCISLSSGRLSWDFRFFRKSPCTNETNSIELSGPFLRGGQLSSYWRIYGAHKRPSPALALSQINPIITTIFQFSVIHFNIMKPPTLWSS
jgi:hypothetical protein